MEKATVVISLSGGLVNAIHIPPSAQLVVLDYDAGEGFALEPQTFVELYGQPQLFQARDDDSPAVVEILGHDDVAWDERYAPALQMAVERG